MYKAPDQPDHKAPLIRYIPKIHGLDTVFLLVLATLVVTALAWYGRYLVPPVSPFQPAALILFIRNPYWLGYSLQTSLIPIVFLYFFSHSRLFRRIVSGETLPDDRLSLIGTLVAFQLLTLGLEIILTHSNVNMPPGFGFVQALSYTLLIPIVAGLLGGWRVGLFVGLNILWIRGTYDFLFRTAHISFYRYESLASWWTSLAWPQIVLQHYLTNAWAITPVWAGIVTGVVAVRLGHRRFSSPVLLGIVAVMYVGTGVLTVINRGGQTAVLWLPTMLIDGAGLLAVGLMIGSARSNLAQRKAEAAELALARAELQALRAQINPHFLFNALTTIRYLVRTDPPSARQLLLDLSQILQRALRSEQFVSLRDELDYVRSYLALEKARFGDRLRVEWALPSDDDLGYPVPVLILQPVVENAVLHGISAKTNGGHVHIAVQRQAGMLLLEVVDDGCGIAPDRLADILSPQTADVRALGIGLCNIDGRLRALYGDRYNLSIQSVIDEGTRVHIAIPIDVEKGE